MKTILVLTDFSKNSRNAADAAILLANKLEAAHILLFNAYTTPPFAPSTELVSWPPGYYSAFKDESNNQIKKESNRLQKVLAQYPQKEPAITLEFLNAEGAVAENVKSLVKEKHVDLILMGGRHKTTGDFIFGSVISNVISKVDCPILIVPNKLSKDKIRNVSFATDLDLSDINAIQYLAGFAKKMNFNIHVCHVSASPVLIPDFEEDLRISRFTNMIHKLKIAPISYHNIEGDNVVKELERFTRKTESDMLTLVHRKHSIFWQLFHQSPSKLLIKHQKKLLLILPEVKETKVEHQTVKKVLRNQKRKSYPIL